jgi:hypothetical protein
MASKSERGGFVFTLMFFLFWGGLVMLVIHPLVGIGMLLASLIMVLAVKQSGSA